MFNYLKSGLNSVKSKVSQSLPFSMAAGSAAGTAGYYAAPTLAMGVIVNAPSLIPSIGAGVFAAGSKTLAAQSLYGLACTTTGAAAVGLATGGAVFVGCAVVEGSARYGAYKYDQYQTKKEYSNLDFSNTVVRSISVEEDSELGAFEMVDVIKIPSWKEKIEQERNEAEFELVM